MTTEELEKKYSAGIEDGKTSVRVKRGLTPDNPRYNAFTVKVWETGYVVLYTGDYMRSTDKEKKFIGETLQKIEALPVTWGRYLKRQRDKRYRERKKLGRV